MLSVELLIGSCNLAHDHCVLKGGKSTGEFLAFLAYVSAGALHAWLPWSLLC